MFAGQTPMSVIASSAINVLRNLQDANAAAESFNTWLVAQVDADLTAAGFSSSDILFLRSAFLDQHALHLLAGGGELPGSYVLPYNFTANATQVAGV